MLLYTSKGVTGTNQFKIHGHLPLHGMLVSSVKLQNHFLMHWDALSQVEALLQGCEG